MPRDPDDHDDSWVDRLDGMLEDLQGTIERLATPVPETPDRTDSLNSPRANREQADDPGRTTSFQRQK